MKRYCRFCGKELKMETLGLLRYNVLFGKPIWKVAFVCPDRGKSPRWAFWNRHRIVIGIVDTSITPEKFEPDWNDRNK